MPDTLDQAFEAVRRMPLAERESMAQAILSLTGGPGERLDIDPEHLSAVLEGLAQIERGDVVEGRADEFVAKAFRRHRP